MSFESLVDLLEHRAGHDGERVFLSSPEDGVDVKYGFFYREAGNLARHLIGRGLVKGERVAVAANNGLNWGVAFWGVLLAGGVAVPLNPKFKPTEAAGLIEQARARFIIADDEGTNLISPETSANGAERYRTDIPLQEDLFIIAIPSGQAAITGSGDNSSQAGDEAVLLFTSGSTGVAKGVVLTHGNLLAAAANIRQGHRLTAADVSLCILPFFHANGLIIVLITTLFAAGRLIVPRKFSANKFWEWANRYQATWFSAVPTILSILLSPEQRGTAPASLRFARSASAALPVAVLEEFERVYGVPVIEAYGLSEAASQVTTNPLPPETRKAGSVGRPAGNEIRVFGEDGREAPPGVTGEVAVRGANVMPGYLNNPEANREAFRDGWLYSGDLGYFDADGFLFLTGRRKELINRAGEKFSPREIDEVIYQLPQVETAAAIGVPDSLFGEEVVAFVQLRTGTQLSADSVLDHCRTLLVDFKVPKRIFYIDDFPRGPSGKVLRRRLAELYDSLAAARQAGV